ncbi:unnamed protein product [Cuscuta epithymum]|uniref:Nudix hydrolase domain-containing protein n=1 Tax=Cuscuta epithymum TaxID=186058 RepID=A0AAV0E6I8_9ASTE|nr:unnamed protein product [Cuscuta epithymum]
MQLRKMECLPSRTGRDLQRYNVQGCRQVVGCIPYRIAKQSSIHGTRGPIDDLEFLLVSSQKSPRMMFPKGGWEVDESLEEAAIRESFEEAGIYGEVGVSYSEAIEACFHPWMKEALDVLVTQITLQQGGGDEKTKKKKDHESSRKGELEEPHPHHHHQLLSLKEAPTSCSIEFLRTELNALL